MRTGTNGVARWVVIEAIRGCGGQPINPPSLCSSPLAQGPTGVGLKT